MSDTFIYLVFYTYFPVTGDKANNNFKIKTAIK